MVKKHRHSGPKVKYMTRKGKDRLRKRPLHKLSKTHRDIFQRLDRKPYETGGYMDFNKKGLEKADLYIGRTGSVDIPVDEDDEVEWHVHQRDKDRRLNRINQFPSTWDIKTFKDYPTQSMLIMHNDKIMMTTKTKKFRVNKKLLSKIDRNLSKDAHKLSTDKLYNKYKTEYKKLGLDIKYYSPESRETGIRIKEMFAHGFKPTRLKKSSTTVRQHRRKGKSVRKHNRRLR